MIIRPAMSGDAPAMTELLNRIIAIGGTTAHQKGRTVDDVRESYITGASVICCHVARVEGRIVGFQAVDIHEALPAGWGDIGTFVQPVMQRSGAGRALFAATRVAAKAAGVGVLNATIRSDNAPGLRFYARLGFADYAHDPDWCLADGTCVGRVSRRFDLA